MSFPGGLILRQNIPRAGLVAEYLANNNTNDTSGNGYNGTPTDITYGTDRKGNANSAFVLNGTSSNIAIDSTLSALSSTTSGSLSAWVKVADATPLTANIIISFSGQTTTDQLNANVRTPGILRLSCVEVLGTNYLLDTDNQVFTDNTWVHVCNVHNGVEPKIYIGGVFVDQTFANQNDKTAWFNKYGGALNKATIGALNFNNEGYSRFTDGCIDDIRIYNRALTQSEITQLANE